MPEGIPLEYTATQKQKQNTADARRSRLTDRQNFPEGCSRVELGGRIQALDTNHQLRQVVELKQMVTPATARQGAERRQPLYASKQKRTSTRQVGWNKMFHTHKPFVSFEHVPPNRSPSRLFTTLLVVRFLSAAAGASDSARASSKVARTLQPAHVASFYRGACLLFEGMINSTMLLCNPLVFSSRGLQELTSHQWHHTRESSTRKAANNQNLTHR